MKTRIFLLTILALGVIGAFIFKVATPPSASPVETAAPIPAAVTASKSASVVTAKQPATVATVAPTVSSQSASRSVVPTTSISAPATVSTTEATTPLAAAPQSAVLLVPGEPVYAQVTIKGQTLSLQPNQVGSFPRINVAPAQTVAVTAQWPEAGAGARVVAAEEDGGLLNDNKKVLALNLDGSGRATFNFTAGQAAGVYRITLRQGSDRKTLDFWVNPDLAQTP